MKRAGAGRRGKIDGQAARRAQMLQRQKEGRREALTLARRVALGVEDVGNGDDSSAARHLTPDTCVPAAVCLAEPDAAGAGMNDDDEGTFHDASNSGHAARKGFGDDRSTSVDGDVGQSWNDRDEEGASWEGLQEQRRREFRELVMLPEWLVELPPDLGGNAWYVVPRPRGMRCLVVAARGHTVCRAKNGRTVRRHPSALPNGSRATGSSADTTILDCFFDKAAGTYYVIDVICWNNVDMADCPSEMRFFWFRSKLAEYPSAGAHAPANPFRFVPVPCFDADLAGLEYAYRGIASAANPGAGHSGGEGGHVTTTTMGLPYARDGLLFYHKEAFYTPGSSPLALLWADAHCSDRFFANVGDGAPESAQRYRDAKVWSIHDIAAHVQVAAAGGTVEAGVSTGMDVTMGE